jgi:flagellar basal-body rod protein FlgF
MDRLAFNAAIAINEARISRQMMTNELSNVSTPGFKRSFEAAMVSIKAEGPGFESRLQPQSMSIDNINMRPGSMMSTGRDLDIALNDKAVLGVTSNDGQLAFTRRGDLSLTANGVLQIGTGQIVRGERGGPITIPPGFKVSINPDGSVYATNPAEQGPTAGVLIDRLLMRDAANTPLERRTDGLYQVSGKAPGTDIQGGNALTTLSPKTLEGSNVNALEVMVKLMEQSRSFEQNVNVIKQSKDADESGASMMRPT